VDPATDHDRQDPARQGCQVPKGAQLAFGARWRWATARRLLIGGTYVRLAILGVCRTAVIAAQPLVFTWRRGLSRVTLGLCFRVSLALPYAPGGRTRLGIACRRWSSREVINLIEVRNLEHQTSNDG